MASSTVPSSRRGVQLPAARAWHAFTRLERATDAVRAAMEDPDTPPEWLGQLRAARLWAGALAIGKEAC